MALSIRYSEGRRARAIVVWVMLTACLFLACVQPTVAAVAEDPSAMESTTDALRAQGTTTHWPSDLLAAMVGDVSDAEAVWLDHQAPDDLRAALTVTYDHTVPSQAMEISHAADGTLRLTAARYESAHGSTVLTWTPTEVTVDDAHYTLTADGDAFSAVLPAPPADGTRITLHFASSLTVDAADYNALVNAAYEAAVAAQTAQDAFAEALADYEAGEAAYAAYEQAQAQYKTDLALYKAYEKALASYNKNKEAYDAYLVDMENYRMAMAAYHQYLADKAAYDSAYALYMELVNDPAAYEARYLAYCAWLNDMSTVEEQLTVLESCFLRDTAGHVLYGTLKGETVATVVSRKEELVSSGCSEADIDHADAATKALTSLLEAYPREGTLAERYAYYMANYGEFRDQVNLLYDSLATLYTNDLVPDILQMQGRLTRYHQFVGQLYVLGCLLDDGKVWQPTWSMGNTKLPTVVDECYLLTDRNKATPLDAYPGEMAEVPSPDAMQKPTPPVEVTCPTEPAKVTEPVKPATVKRPTAPKPVAKPDPTVRPVAPVFSAELEALRLAVQEGTLTRRTESDVAVSVPVSTRREKTVYPDGVVYAQFYGYDGVTVYDAPKADGEGYIALPTPPTAPDNRYSEYAFVGWVYADGRWLTESTPVLTEPTDFYPVFSSTLKTHTVTWVVGEETVTQQVPYGVKPNFTGSTHRAADEAYVYEFTGWSPDPAAVVGDVTYTAQYRAIPRTYTVTWQIDGTTLEEVYSYGSLPTSEAPVKPMNGRYIYAFVGWSPEVMPVNGDAVYQAIFETVDLLPNTAADAAVSVEKTEQAWIVRDQRGENDDGVRRFDIGRMAAQAVEDGCPLILMAEGVTVCLNDNALQVATAAEANYLAVEWRDGCLSVSLCDADGQGLTAASEQMAVTLTLSPPVGQTVRLYLGDGSLLAVGKGGESVTFTATGGKTYAYDMGYAVTVVEAVGGVVEISTPCAPTGDTVWLTAIAQPGYDLRDVQAFTGDGTPVALTLTEDGRYTLVMPSADIHVTPTFTPKTYRVVFTVDGSVISEQTCHYGEMPTLPPDPSKPDDGTYAYTFDGWSPHITAVLADITYEATFLAVPLHGDDSVKDTALKLWQAALIGLTSYLVTTSAILIPYLAVRKRRRGR